MKTIQKLALILCVCPSLLLADDKAAADKVLPIKVVKQQETTQNKPQADKKAETPVEAPQDKESKEITETKIATTGKQVAVKSTDKKELSTKPMSKKADKADVTKKEQPKEQGEEQALLELEKMFQQMEAEEAQKKAAAQATDTNSKKETNKAALANVAAKKADAANKPAPKQVELT